MNIRPIHIMAVLLLPSLGYGQVAGKLLAEPDPKEDLMVVETSCGECNFGLRGDGCDVAVRLPEGSFYVKGVGISEYGHPHDANGFCMVVRKAEVQGKVVDGRFQATYFKLLPVDTEKPLGQERMDKQKKRKARRGGKVGDS